MTDIKKYEGIIPAFYACYDAEGKVSPEACKALTQYYIDKGVQGLYVGGSSGECIYQSKEERKAVLEAVMEVAKGKLTIIAHIACNNTADSQELAAHAESLGVDAIASIPPIYFKLPPHLQHSSAGWRFPVHPPAEGDAEEPQGHRRQELLHAHSGHPDVA